MNKKNLVGHADKVKPKTTPNLIDTELYELITQKKNKTDYSFNIMKIFPGGKVKEQSHPEQHAVFVLDGKCKTLLGDKWESARKGNFFCIPGHLAHAFSNSEKLPVEILIIKI